MVLITGGTGAIGRRLVSLLIARGRTVRVLTLPGDVQAAATEALGAGVVYGDVRDKASVAAACAGIETVYHLAAVILAPRHPELFRRINVQGTENVAAAAKEAGVKHLIYVSSASVVYPWSNAYSRSKRAAEAAVAASGVPFTVVRPTLVYDNGGAEEFVRFARYLRRFPVVPFMGTGAALKSPVHADDLATGMAAIEGNETAYGKTYNLSGGEHIPIRQVAEMLLGKMGLKKTIVPVPVVLCRMLAVVAVAAGRLFGFEPPFTWQTVSGIIQDADLDIEDAQRDLNYAPRPFAQGLEEIEIGI